jgi:hypothetical protein
MTYSKTKDIVLEEYRYQLVPNSTTIQSTIDGICSYDDLIRQKNEILFKVLKLQNLQLLSRDDSLLYKIVNSNEKCCLIKLGKQRSIDIDTKDFTKETISTYPNLFVYFNNDPNVQKIHIQRNYDAFTTTHTPANVLERSINRHLKKWQLSIYIKPVLTESSFWDIVGSHKDKLQQVSFELIKPNMSNISHSLAEDLKQLQSHTNSHTTKLELSSPKDAFLENITSDNAELTSIVNYAQAGGGEMSVKIKGIRKKVKPTNIIEIAIDEVEIAGKTGGQIFDTFTKTLCD